MRIRTYKELSRLETFAERFQYLKLVGEVGKETFGYDRWLNQVLYHSDEWHRVRNQIIIRDNGCDLGIPDLEIRGRILVHHMNPITEDDILQHSDFLLNPDFLICVSHNTHNAIHYGDDSILKTWRAREPGDTKLW